MSIGNYSDLQSEIAARLMRDNLSERIPGLITLAEARMNRNLRVRQMEESKTEVITDGFAALPPDWIEFIGKPEVDGAPVSLLTRDQMKRVESGDYYSIFGSKVKAFGNEITFDYYAKIPALSDSNATNWLLEDAPDAYIYASLLEAEPVIKNDKRIATWRTFLERALGDLQNQSDRAKFSGGQLAIQVGLPE